MPNPNAPDRILGSSIGQPRSHQIIGNPRRRWPREADFTGWLASNLDQLASCLGVQRLACTGREVIIGERWTAPGWRGHEQTVGGMRVDLTARSERDELLIVEAQIGQADHAHLGQLVTYAHAAAADLAVWVVADTDPVFSASHLATLAELNDAFAGRRQFYAVAVTVESASSPVPLAPDVPLNPRLRRIDLQTQQWAD